MARVSGIAKIIAEARDVQRELDADVAPRVGRRTFLRARWSFSRRFILDRIVVARPAAGSWSAAAERNAGMALYASGRDAVHQLVDLQFDLSRGASNRL